MDTNPSVYILRASNIISTSRFDFLIIGSGVFGASTAYHLSQSHPKASIALLDRSSSFPCSLAASHDFNKIVRADYANAFYCKLALEARELWKNNPLYKPCYHQPGMVILGNTGVGKQIVENYKELNSTSEAAVFATDEMENMYDSLFGDTDYRGVDEVFLNPQSGWADATLAVRDVIEAAVSKGVECVEGYVTKLVLGNHGCTSVALQDGCTISAGKVMLSTGAGTAKLLADSAPEQPNLQSRDSINATAVVTGAVKLSPTQVERFEKAPAFIHAAGEVLDEYQIVQTASIITRVDEFRRMPCSNTRWHSKVLRRCQLQKHLPSPRIRTNYFCSSTSVRPRTAHYSEAAER